MLHRPWALLQNRFTFSVVCRRQQESQQTTLDCVVFQTTVQALRVVKKKKQLELRNRKQWRWMRHHARRNEALGKKEDGVTFCEVQELSGLELTRVSSDFVPGGVLRFSPPNYLSATLWCRGRGAQNTTEEICASLSSLWNTLLIPDVSFPTSPVLFSPPPPNAALLNQSVRMNQMNTKMKYHAFSRKKTMRVFPTDHLNWGFFWLSVFLQTKVRWTGLK